MVIFLILQVFKIKDHEETLQEFLKSVWPPRVLKLVRVLKLGLTTTSFKNRTSFKTRYRFLKLVRVLKIGLTYIISLLNS